MMALEILPDELIMEILSRLNVKSLMAVKCVCKSWNTFISDPCFVKMHLKLSKRNRHIAFLSEGYPYVYCNTVFLISVSRLLSNSIIHTDDRYYQFKLMNCSQIVGSCNGLICLRGYSYDYLYYGCKMPFYFWNPATRTKSETSLSLPRYHKVIRVGFGYDNSTDTYKLGLIIHCGLGNQVTTTVKVFTLGYNIWRGIYSFPVRVVLPSSIDKVDVKVKYDGVYLSNSISWLFHKNLTTDHKFVIVSLDLGTKTFTQLSLPLCCDELPFHYSTLSVLMDCICFSHDFKTTHFVIWQMKEFGVEQSWTQFLKISYQNLQINYELGDYDFQLLPLCISENEATLVLGINSTKRNEAILFNWRDKRVEKIEKTHGVWWYTAKDYVESLVSTCVDKKARETI